MKSPQLALVVSLFTCAFASAQDADRYGALAPLEESRPDRAVIAAQDVSESESKGTAAQSPAAQSPQPRVGQEIPRADAKLEISSPRDDSRAPATSHVQDAGQSVVTPSEPGRLNPGRVDRTSPRIPTEQDNLATDDTVRPAGALVPVRGEDASHPARVIKQLLTPPQGAELTGRPLSLQEALAAKEYLQPRHLEIIRSYWQLCDSLAEYYAAVRGREYLASVTNGSRMSQPLNVLAAVDSSKARVKLALADVVVQQHTLAGHLGWSPDGSLPVPADAPLTAPYRTYYESIRKSRAFNEEEQRTAARIHAVLPLNLAALEASAAAFDRADELWQQQRRRYAEGKTAAAELLAAQAGQEAERRRFQQAVQARNLAIADYAWIVASEVMTPSDLLPMLIRMPERPLAVAPLEARPLGQLPGMAPTLAQGVAPPLLSPQNPFPELTDLDAVRRASPVASPRAAPSAVVPAGGIIDTNQSAVQPAGAWETASDGRPLRSVVVPPQN